MNMDSNKFCPIDVNKISEELKVRPEVYLKIVQNFSNSLPGKIKKLQEAMTVNNNDQMRMILHEIKGTSGNLRLTFISEPESMMHAAVKSGETPARLEQYFETLRTATENLQRYVVQLVVQTPESENTSEEGVDEPPNSTPS